MSPPITAPSVASKQEGGASGGGGKCGGSDIPASLVRELEKLALKPLAARPGLGTTGRPINIYGNFFPIRLQSPNILLSRYFVEILHPSKSRKMTKGETQLAFWTAVDKVKRLAFWTEVDKVKPLASNYGIAYDGDHIAFSLSPLTFPETGESGEVEIAIGLERDTRSLTDLRVSFKLVSSTINLSDLQSSRVSFKGGELSAGAVQAMDIIIRQQLACPMIPVAKNFYCHKNSVFPLGAQPLDLGVGIEMWTGFQSSALLCAGNKMLLNVDVSHGAFYKKGIPFLYYMEELTRGGGGGGGGFRGGRGGPRGGGMMRGGGGRGGGGRGGYGDRPGLGWWAMGPGGDNPGSGGGGFNVASLNQGSALSPQDIKAINSAMKGKGVRVRTSYLQSPKTYKVVGLTERSASDITFEMESKDGGEPKTLSVAQYFNTKYGALKFPKMPCLQVGPPKRELYVPVESLTVVTPLKFNAKLSEDQVSTMIRQTAVDAETRKNKILGMMREAQYQEDPWMKTFGLQLDLSMVEIRGRVIPAPHIQYKGCGTQSRTSLITPRDGAWQSQRQQLLSVPDNFTEYSLIAMANQQRDEKALINFCQIMHTTAGGMGWKIPPNPRFVKYVRNAEELASQYEQIANDYKNNGVVCNLIFVVLPGKDPNAYISTKHVSDMCTGVMSQCILMKTILKINPTTCMNILFKLTAKLGGVPHCPKPSPAMAKFVDGQPTLILGVDVTHPTLGEADVNLPSVASVVGSTDLHGMKYGASIKIQRGAQESVVYLVDKVKERIIAFYKLTNSRPNRILVYRDGVADGQFEIVMKEEIASIRRACITLAEDYMPKITFVVVQKRHHARLFCANPRDQVGKAKNIPPGTVVDTTIVSPDCFDFYLCSHFGIQGTSRPTKYFVLLDENGMTSDELQNITYSLCHNFVRCPRAVSVPAPAYYADLLALRARAHVKRHLGISDSASLVSAGPRKTTTTTTPAPTATDSGVATTASAPTATATATVTGSATGTAQEGEKTGQSHTSGTSMDEAVRVVPDMANSMYFV